MENITESNRLIAEFMGKQDIMTEVDFLSMEHKSHNPTIIEYLEYHTSWDWLMPCLHKCLQYCHENMLNERENSFSDKLFTCAIEPMYKEVILFIQWYNENKN